MLVARGVIALMGSGELTGTMVETHKALLARCGKHGKAVFLDTPAGFQLNVDLIARKAVEYFGRHVRHPMEIASFRSLETATPKDAEKAYRSLGEAGFVLIGPGSPTYTVRQLKDTPIPALLSEMVARGGCLVAASAAALTVGSHTLPVYEIYKVGEPLHWTGGLNLLGLFGLDLVVVPHWNNAEGGNHDTRFCYMGEPRFRLLEDMLPEGTTILGLDEHTACILDFAQRDFAVEGIGRVTIRSRGRQLVLERGERLSFECLARADSVTPREAVLTRDSDSVPEQKSPFWDRMRRIEDVWHASLDQKDWVGAAAQLLEMDRLVWEAQEDAESPESISQAREVFREMVVHMGTRRAEAASFPVSRFENLVGELLSLRERYRKAGRWDESDEIRSRLQRAGVVIEDTEGGPQWRTTKSDEAV